METDVQQCWCLTLPLVEERALSAEERLELERERRRALWVAGVCLLLAVLSVVGAALGMVAAREHLGLMGLCWVFGPVGLAGGGIWGVVRLAHAVRLGNELRAATIQVFRGVVDGSVIAPLQLTRLKKQGLRLDGTEESLERLAGSGRITRVNDTPYRGDALILPTVVTAPLPPYAGIAAQWLDRVETSDEGGPVFHGRRELSADERGELRSAARRARRRGFQRPLFLGVLSLGFVVIGVTQGQILSVPLAIFAVVLLVTLPALLRAISFAGHLDAAAREGTVDILRMPASDIHRADTGTTLATDDTPVTVEVIPAPPHNLGLLWTLDGIPAAWRRE